MRKLTRVAVFAALAIAWVLPAAAQSLTERLATCLACHGEQGRSQTPEVPSLGGQPEFYLTTQLVMFREGMRTVEPMTSMLKGVTDRDLRVMAAALAKLPVPAPEAAPGDAARQEQARALAEQHRCNFCHTRNYGGMENVPRIAGQREEYLVKALREYKANTRRGYDPAMADVVLPLTEENIADLAYFLTRQP